MSKKLIALAGVARAGKDDFTKSLVSRGWTRLAYGDIIKEFFRPTIKLDEPTFDTLDRILEVNPKVDYDQLTTFTAEILPKFQQCLDEEFPELQGLDPFSEVDQEKKCFRPILEHGGKLIYQWVTETFYNQVDACTTNVINPRCVFPEEASKWRLLGGELLLIDAIHVEAVSQWEKNAMLELKRSGLISGILPNWSTKEDWIIFAEEYADGLRTWPSSPLLKV